MPPCAARKLALNSLAPCALRELTPRVPAASPSVIAANRHAAPPRSGRSAGSTPRASSEPPPATSAIGASARARPTSHPSATSRPCPARPPSQPP